MGQADGGSGCQVLSIREATSRAGSGACCERAWRASRVQSRLLLAERVWVRAAGGIALGRLKEERKQWRKEHPYDFYARPEPKETGGSNLMKWCVGAHAPVTPIAQCSLAVPRLLSYR